MHTNPPAGQKSATGVIHAMNENYIHLHIYCMYGSCIDPNK